MKPMNVLRAMLGGATLALLLAGGFGQHIAGNDRCHSSNRSCLRVADFAYDGIARSLKKTGHFSEQEAP